MHKPFVVGIAGGSASGKSTFCNQLKESLVEYKLQVFHMDHYFKPENLRPYVKSPLSEKMYIDDNHPDTIDLPKLRHDLSHAISENQVNVILVEGLLVLADVEICRQLDLKLFIECRADERIVRRLKRNMTWGLTFDQISDVYLDMVRYRHDEFVEPSKWNADLILNGSSFSELSLNLISNSIKAEIS